MNGLERRIDEAKECLDLPLDDAAIDRLRAGTLARAHRRERTRRTVVSVAAVLALGVGISTLRGWPSEAPRVATDERSGDATRPILPRATEVRVTRDGRVEVDGDATGVRTREATSRRVVLELRAGAARFEVAPHPERTVEVQAGEARITVLGTAFIVEHHEAAVRVEVVYGEVDLDCHGSSHLLRTGDQRDCANESADAPRSEGPRDGRAHESVLSSPRLERGERPSSRRRIETPTGAGDWRDLAAEGDFDGAYRAMQAPGARAVTDHPEELLKAADVARLSGHAAQAIGPLERILTQHARDPRAPLAAFTLGRLHLDELGNPRAAAEAFALARRLRSDGPLAQDALAREVEARSRAGEDRVAQRLAEEYVRTYPTGTRIRSVRRFGGLE